MSATPIRVLIVDATPKEHGAMPRRANDLENIDVVGVAYNRRSAGEQAETLNPDVMLVDLMLPGYRSIDLVRNVARTQPDIRLLAISPEDPPHDRIMLAAEAGALGFISKHAPTSEFDKAIQAVHQGKPWLPEEETYEVLQDGASELALSSTERRNRLTQIIFGLIPLTGLIAAITAFLWREYWGTISVRVADLGVDPTTRMMDVIVSFILILGMFGPILFARPWVLSIGNWIETRPKLAKAVTAVRGLRLGRLPVGIFLLNYWIAWLLMILLVLSITFVLTKIMPLVMVLFVGPAVGIILIANVLDMDDELPEFLHLPHLDSWRVLGFLGVVLVVFLLALGVEVMITGPDLRTDGLHGFLAPAVLGFSAKPAMIYDLDEKQEPLGALYLGGNADLYVLYDPCTEIVRFVPVGSSRVELVSEVHCSSP